MGGEYFTAAVNSIGTATDNVAKAFQRGEFLDLTIWDFILGGLVWSLGMIMAAIAAWVILRTLRDFFWGLGELIIDGYRAMVRLIRWIGGSKSKNGG